VGRRRSRKPLLLVLLGLLVAALVAAGIVAFLRGGDDGTSGSAPSTPVTLTGVAAYDPEGGDGEHDADAPLATDGDPSTYWPTETYNTFAKSGVGVVLDAGRDVDLSRVTVRTDTPGFTAEIREGSSPEGPFDTRVSPSRTVNGRTTFPIDGDPSRYYVVWITSLDGIAHVDEVTARSE
jgi:putative peptidoglycan lipid II flippase